MVSAYIGIIIASAGVVTRHYVDYGNAKLGFIVSLVVALLVISVSKKMTEKYKVTA